VYALSGYVAGDFPACNKGLNVAMKVLANMVRGCRVSRHPRIQKEARVGFAHHHRPMVPRIMVTAGSSHAQHQ
jgi:hypothetical protein